VFSSGCNRWKLLNNEDFLRPWVLNPTPNPNLEDQGVLFVWVIAFDLSGMGGSTSSYATAGIALMIIWPRKPHHYFKVGIPTRGYSSL
jgi:hypothetical protein